MVIFTADEIYGGIKLKKLKYILGFLLLCLIIKSMYIPEAPYDVKEMVLENEEAYTSIAKLYYTDYLGSKSKVVSYYYDEDGEIIRHTDPKFSLVLGEEEIANCGVIYDTYRDVMDKTWAGAYAYKGYVAFDNEARHKSLVYSVNGRPPKYVCAPGEPHKNVRCSKINDNWYYMEMDYSFYEYVYFYLHYIFIVEEWGHILVIIILAVIVLKILYDLTAPEEMKELLQSNGDRYSTLAKALYKDYQKNKDKCVVYSIEDGSIQRYTSPSYEIKLSEEEEIAYLSVINSYSQLHKNWDAIYIYKNFVLFRNVTERESLIYAVKNRRPHKIMVPDGKFAYCKKLTKHWYYFSSKRWG